MLLGLNHISVGKVLIGLLVVATRLARHVVGPRAIYDGGDPGYHIQPVFVTAS
jgi:hypothetical protein